MAIAGIDMAAWDAHSKACGLPLVGLLGGEPKRIPAYNSCGLGLIGIDRVGREPPSWLPDSAPSRSAWLSRPRHRRRRGYARVREAVGPESTSCPITTSVSRSPKPCSVPVA